MGRRYDEVESPQLEEGPEVGLEDIESLMEFQFGFYVAVRLASGCVRRLVSSAG